SRQGWCQPSLAARRMTKAVNNSGAAASVSRQNDGITERPEAPPDYLGLKSRLRRMSVGISEGLTFNFDQPSKIPGSALILLILCLTTFIYIALQVILSNVRVREMTWQNRIGIIGGIAILVALAANELVVARFLSANGSLSSSTIL